MSGMPTLGDALAYAQGWVRYHCYYRRWLAWLIPLHVREQISCRIRSMESECLRRGSCVLCGCATTALQMADKACDRPCYPAMASRRMWRSWKTYGGVHHCPETRMKWTMDRAKGRFARYV